MHGVRSRVVLAGVVVLATGAFGCRAKRDAEPQTSSSAAAHAGAPPARPLLEPCRLLTAGEASALLGGLAKAIPYDKLAYASSCIWEASNPRRGLVVMTSSREQLRADQALRTADADTLEKRFAQVVASESATGVEPVSNLGDAALWAKNAGQLWILKKNRVVVTVGFQGDTPRPDARERSLDAGRLIVPRLGG